MAKSSGNRSQQILGVISAARAERLLTEWVNTDLTNFTGDANAWARLFRRCPEIPSVATSEILPPFDEAHFDRFHQQMEAAEVVAQYLRDAWDAPDMRRFEWYTLKAQNEYEYEAACASTDVTPSHVMPRPGDEAKFKAAITKSDEPPSIVTPVEAAIFHLRRNRKRALHCPNSECPAPYFFSTKKGQKFCSLACAKPSQRAAKRRWWAENRATKVPKTTSEGRSK